MLEVELFLGFPVDALFLGQMAKANPEVVEHFLRSGDKYLVEIHHQGIRYFGKRVGRVVALPQLQPLEDNIYSLLKRIVPEFPYQETPLYLFPITTLTADGE